MLSWRRATTPPHFLYSVHNSKKDSELHHSIPLIHPNQSISMTPQGSKTSPVSRLLRAVVPSDRMSLWDLQARRLSMELRDRSPSTTQASLRAMMPPFISRDDRPLEDIMDDALRLLEDHPLRYEHRAGPVGPRPAPRIDRRMNDNDHNDNDEAPTN
jgi:hypothetical protein